MMKLNFEFYIIRYIQSISDGVALSTVLIVLEAMKGDKTMKQYETNMKKMMMRRKYVLFVDVCDVQEYIKGTRATTDVSQYQNKKCCCFGLLKP